MTYEAFDFKTKLKLDDGTVKTFVVGKEQKEEDKKPVSGIKKIYPKQHQDKDGDDVMKKA